MKTKNFTHFSKRSYIFIFMMAFATVFSSTLFGATVTWDGGGSDGKWSTATNWDGDALPAEGDDVVITGATVTLDVTTPLLASLSLNSNVEVAKLTVNSGSVLSVAYNTTSTSIAPIILAGGDLVNNGEVVLSTNQNGNNLMIMNSVAGAVEFADKYSGTGTLTLNLPSTSTAYAIKCAQAITTSEFHTGSDIIISTNNRWIFLLATATGLIIDKTAGSDGVTNISGPSSDPATCGLILFNPNPSSLTINSGVTINMTSSFTGTKGLIGINSGTQVMTNNGNLNLTASNPAGSTTVPIAFWCNTSFTLTNNGTITLTNFPVNLINNTNKTTVVENNRTFSINAGASVQGIAVGTTFNNNVGGILNGPCLISAGTYVGNGGVDNHTNLAAAFNDTRYQLNDIYSYGSDIVVNNFKGSKINVFSISGQLVKSIIAISDSEIISANRGIYLVNAGNKFSKVIIK